MVSLTPSPLISASSQHPSPLDRSEKADKIRVELAIDLNQQDDLKKIEEALKSKGVQLISADEKGKTIQLELDATAAAQNELGNVQSLQRFIEKETGILTVVKGLGDISSAVVELRPPNSIIGGGGLPLGVLRLSQLDGDRCFVDGAISGLEITSDCDRLGRHLLAIHEYGDLSSNNYESIGKPLIHIESQSRNVDNMSIRKIIPQCNVASMIGRSVAISESKEETVSPSKRILSAGIIARASTILANAKQICSCSGKTLWQERLDKRQSERQDD